MRREVERTAKAVHYMILWVLENFVSQGLPTATKSWRIRMMGRFSFVGKISFRGTSHWFLRRRSMTGKAAGLLAPARRSWATGTSAVPAAGPQAPARFRFLSVLRVDVCSYIWVERKETILRHVRDLSRRGEERTAETARCMTVWVLENFGSQGLPEATKVLEDRNFSASTSGHCGICTRRFLGRWS